MRVTVNEIAKICGVSRTTVLRALNNQARVSEATRRKVLEVAKDLGYRPNLLARSFTTGRTMTIGFVAINVDNMVFVESLSALNQEAMHHGYSLNVALAGDSGETELKHIREFADRRVEGILLSAVNQGKKYEEFLKSLNIPIVCIGNDVSGDFSTVMIDEAQAARDAVRLILSKGYQRVIFVCPPLCEQGEINVYSHLRRKAGFEEELSQHPHIARQIISGEDYITQLEPVLKTLKTRTAILCSGDIYALDIMRYFKTRKIKTPRDIGIMGFDNIKMLEYIVPRLTTVSTNVEKVAAVAVNELISQIRDESAVPKKIVLAHRILDMETL